MARPPQTSNPVPSNAQELDNGQVTLLFVTIAITIALIPYQQVVSLLKTAFFS